MHFKNVHITVLPIHYIITPRVWTCVLIGSQLNRVRLSPVCGDTESLTCIPFFPGGYHRSSCCLLLPASQSVTLYVLPYRNILSTLSFNVIVYQLLLLILSINFLTFRFVLFSTWPVILKTGRVPVMTSPSS